MKSIHTRISTVLALTLLLSLGACSNMSTRDKNTAIGAGVGAIGGSILTGGSTAGAIGGAAVGGVIGNQVDRK
ncbi:MAG: osmotically-inducible lipoprotein OsmB [Gammaproteobacteria bacterium]|jgi:osmotically inducible lipoprotein OsmB|nr:osmotically-inducible lipoprotein OsmB [Gammaproteobacteria bacterium]MBU0788799.1 osmotically-inducible lipoprotein OsmB [Gammaproteobacteria bacterium]MBU0814581.1 osmotically-inducible lipoprotein OsmB [Gammaproteobacteria bacterium]MBU1786576.1 osmotically-inducible lipoprotein OsmB [Gammaproteobacteria bacterium]